MSDWNEARRATIARWQGIRAAAGHTHPLDLLEEANAADPLCATAEADRQRGGEGTRCENCLWYRQFGGCQETLGRLNDHIAKRDWVAVRGQADEILAHLEILQTPAEI